MLTSRGPTYNWKKCDELPAKLAEGEVLPPVPTEQVQTPSLFGPGQPPANREVASQTPLLASAAVQTGQATAEVARLQTGLLAPGSVVHAASLATVDVL